MAEAVYALKDSATVQHPSVDASLPVYDLFVSYSDILAITEKISSASFFEQV